MPALYIYYMDRQDRHYTQGNELSDVFRKYEDYLLDNQEVKDIVQIWRKKCLQLMLQLCHQQAPKTVSKGSLIK